MTDKLKPCPFCGGEAVAVEEKPGYGFVQCAKCGASTDPGLMQTPEQLLLAWNARWERTCHMDYKSLYDEEGADGIECDECGWSDLQDPGYPYPAHCPGCGAKVVPE